MQRVFNGPAKLFLRCGRSDMPRRWIARLLTIKYFHSELKLGDPAAMLSTQVDPPSGKMIYATDLECSRVIVNHSTLLSRGLVDLQEIWWLVVLIDLHRARVVGKHLVPDVAEELGWKAMNPIREVFHDGPKLGWRGHFCV